jgi:hypothetical protein
MTPEQLEKKRETARRNGAKSKGPVTAAGKHRSSMNAISVGKYVAVHDEELPPAVRILTVEDRKAYVRLYQANLRQYGPQSESELSIVRNITAEQFEYERYRRIETLQLQSEHDQMLSDWPEVPPEQLSGYAIEHSVLNNKVHRFIERKMKAHLLAWTRFVALYERIRKSFPAALDSEPEVAEAKNEPKVPLPERPTKSISNEQLTRKVTPSCNSVESNKRYPKPPPKPVA